jgi:hypothetical protein
MQTGIVGEMRRTHELALRVVGPAVERADDVLGMVFRASRPCNICAWRCRQTLDSSSMPLALLTSILPPPCSQSSTWKSPVFGGHQFDDPRSWRHALEQQFLSRVRINLGVEIPVAPAGRGIPWVSRDAELSSDMIPVSSKNPDKTRSNKSEARGRDYARAAPPRARRQGSPDSGFRGCDKRRHFGKRPQFRHAEPGGQAGGLIEGPPWPGHAG